MTPELLLTRLEPPTGPIDLVLDTDTYNEIDDQFALVYAAIATDKIRLRAVHAAPFSNRRSSGPEDGMEKSYEEILRVLSRLDMPHDQLVFRGSTRFLTETKDPVPSESVENLCRLADEMPAGQPLYVAAIGAITNVASALLIRPDLADKLVVVWLGGHPLSWSNNHEFNFMQDPYSVQAVVDSGVPFIQIPCVNVAEHIRTTAAEMEVLFKGKGAIGDYLYDIYLEYVQNIPGVSKVIWDISAIAWLLDGESFQSVTVSAPQLQTDGPLSWIETEGRHFIRSCTRLNRDRIFRDMVERLEGYLSRSTG